MPKYPFIDMHIHLFNAHYLPLHGIFRNIAHLPGAIARPLAVIINAITRSSNFSKLPDEDFVASSIDAMNGDDESVFKFYTDRLFEVISDWSNVATEFGISSELKELTQALENLVHEYTTDVLNEFSLVQFTASISDPRQSAGLRQSREFELVREALFWAFQELELAAGPDALEHDFSHQTGAAASKSAKNTSSDRFNFRTGLNFMRFLCLLLSTERKIYEALLKGYGDDRQPLLVVNHMLDMEKAFHKFLRIKPKWEFLEQIDRMVKLAHENNGKIVTFAAVDPRRSDWKEYIDSAICHKIRGFKFYSPLGYRPINMADDSGYNTPVNPDAFKAPHPKPNSDKMNKRIEGILRKCKDEDLRLFAHCTPSGVQAYKGAGLHCDPAYWDRAINEYQLDNLWLCIGHSGGTSKIDWHGWAAEDAHWEQTFAYRVVQLCRDHENVYCELGYLWELFDQDHLGNKILDRLYTELTRTTDSKYQLHDKIMYGTDWHMSNMITKTGGYLDIFTKFFDEHPDLTKEDSARSNIAEQFFSGNAKRFLGPIYDRAIRQQQQHGEENRSKLSP